MSESSSSKTKRKFVNYLLDYHWEQQVSVMYTHFKDLQFAPDHKTIITDQLGRAFPDRSFLYRLCLTTKPGGILCDLDKDHKRITMPYHTFFTNDPIEIKDLQKALERRLGVNLEVKRKRISEERIERYANTIHRQEPHNLRAYFPEHSSLRRMTVIGTKHLEKIN